MPLHPLGANILLQQIEEPGTHSGDVVLPSSARESSREALVLATGPGRFTEQGTRIPLDVHSGDRVLVRRYAGIEVEVDGRELILVQEDEILGTIT